MHKIHLKPEERLAQTSEESVDLLKSVNEKIKLMTEAIKCIEKEKTEPVNINIKLDLK